MQPSHAEDHSSVNGQIDCICSHFMGPSQSSCPPCASLAVSLSRGPRGAVGVSSQPPTCAVQYIKSVTIIDSVPAVLWRLRLLVKVSVACFAALVTARMKMRAFQSALFLSTAVASLPQQVQYRLQEECRSIRAGDCRASQHAARG
jgi:hypothetical protein